MSVDTPIIDFGVDSLVAAGVRSWLLSEHKVEVPVLKILGGSSVAQGELPEQAARLALAASLYLC